MANGDWITIQFFVSDDGTCEVQGSHKNYRKMKCTCSDFNTLTRCKHVRYMRRYIDKNDGVFSLRIPDTVGDDEIDAVVNGDANFRDMLLKYGKVIYIP